MKAREILSAISGAAMLWAGILVVAFVAARLGCSEVPFTGISILEPAAENGEMKR